MIRVVYFRDRGTKRLLCKFLVPVGCGIDHPALTIAKRRHVVKYNEKRHIEYHYFYVSRDDFSRAMMR